MQSSFTFHFAGIEHAWLWLAGLAAGGWALVAVYRGIFQRSERQLTWALMVLRGAGLLALAVALAKPEWLRHTPRVEPGRLAVILDNSLSMSLADASGKSRYALGRAAALAIRDRVEAAGPGPRVKADLFDINGEPLPDGPPPEPRVDRTDLTRALSRAVAALRAQPLVGVVLISDGVDNAGPSEPPASGVPIYAIGFREDPQAARMDLSVENVQAPARAMVNNTIRVDVRLRKTAGPAAEAAVAVKRGRETFASKPVSFAAGDAEQTVSMNLTPAEAGTFVYTVSVASDTGERVLANNAKPFPLQVNADAIRVFYVEGFLRYEYKFLRTRLEDDPDVSLVSVVRRANPSRLAQSDSGGELITPARLKNFEVVILGDMEGGYLDPSEYQALTRWVDEGHALLVLGGYRSFGPNGFRSTPLADALPVVFAEAEPSQSEESFVLQLAEPGKEHPIFEVSGDRVKDEQLWSTAPALLGCSLVGGVKPGADVLAVNPNVSAGGKPAPVIAVQRYGGGHTMVLAADTTWRWSRLARVAGQSDTLFARFWSQAVRWLAGRDPEASRPPIVLSTDRPDYNVGVPVAVRIARQAAPDRSAGDLTVEAAGESGKPVPVPVKATPDDPDVFTGTFQPAAAGRYEVSASLREGGKLVANQTVDVLVHGSDIELADTRTDFRRLQAMAAASGGLYADVADASGLTDRIERKDRRTADIRRVEMWNSPWLFLFFLGAVSAEWVVRRRNHLV